MVIYLTGTSELLCLRCERMNECEFVFVFNIIYCFLTSECLCLPVTYSSSLYLTSIFCVPYLIVFFLISLLFLESEGYKT